jgi:hypothetical protein
MPLPPAIRGENEFVRDASPTTTFRKKRVATKIEFQPLSKLNEP